jgi:2-dehydro-3-deoxyphosphogluconate aldolase/(4S)-4-hydroxy-2-oxoglutarate aldolase
MKLENMIREHKIIAIMRNVPFEKTTEYVNAICSGGIRLIEVALNSEKALEQIELIRSRFSSFAFIGAGTAITKKLAQSAVAAGAQFLLTPSVGEEVLRHCSENEIELLPGVMTPTDVEVCLRYGYKTMKLFPAGDLPTSYIKSLKGPFDDTNYVAVGGVEPGNAAEFLRRGFIGVGISGSLVPAELIEENRWDDVRNHISALVHSIDS